MALTPHSPEWYDRLARMQRGYYYPWKSRIAPFNGEDTFMEMVRAHVSPSHDVLEIGCGHGEVALQIAPLCKSVLAYDRVGAYIEMAREEAISQGVANVRFVCADSSGRANKGIPRIPAEPGSYDLLLSRRGPMHWLIDALRVAKPGAVLLQLNPDATPAPPWNQELPEMLRFNETEQKPIRKEVEHRLASAGLRLHSCWSYDVPELLLDAHQLYLLRTFGCAPDEVPAFEDVRAALEAVFDRHAQPGGLEIRHRRFMWKAVIPT